MKKIFKLGIMGTCIAVLIGLTGCASTSDKMQTLQDELTQKDEQISQLTQEVETKDETLKSYEQQQFELDEQNRKMKENELLDTAPLLPPNPKVGECYARVFVEPTYRTVEETVLKNEASERVEIIPAVYDYVEEQVLVKEASEKLEIIPAKYEWKTESVLVKDASYEMVDVPAEYEWKEERILVKPAHTVWKKGRGLIEKIDNNTGEIMCLVEIPAQYETVRKQVLKTPATSRRVEIPAQYEEIKKKVLVEPATVEKVVIPAEYETVRVRKMVTPPQERRIDIPAEYTTIERTEKVAEGKLEWRRVLCETNMGEDVIERLQTALRDNGYDPIFIDGVVGWRTMKALKAYQEDKGLAVGEITYETLESLGIVKQI